MIDTPYLLFLGDAPDNLAAKVAFGIKDWRPDLCVGQLSLEGCASDLGLAELSIEQALEQGAKTLVIGVANRGGVIADAWLDVLVQALQAGLDIASGLHNHLSDQPRLRACAEQYNRRLIDVRVPQSEYPIANGKKRTGKRCLAVGTDCSVGKMYTALALDKVLRARGCDVDFRATGQTGILITGDGVPLDAVVADFMAGSIEALSPDNNPDHWDMIEGQGSLFHPSFSGVTLALIHGAQADALILCHEPTRTHMRGLPHYSVPTLAELQDSALKAARLVNPNCRVVGISINSAHMSEQDARDYLRQVEDEMQLPATDPYRFGCEKLADALMSC